MINMYLFATIIAQAVTLAALAAVAAVHLADGDSNPTGGYGAGI